MEAKDKTKKSLENIMSDVCTIIHASLLWIGVVTCCYEEARHDDEELVI